MDRWLQTAGDWAKRLAGASPAARQALIAHEAKKAGLNAQTLRRQINAAEVAIIAAERAGIPFDKVTAPLAALEAWSTLEQRDPARAADVRKTVLLGRMSQRQVRALLNGQTSKGSTSRDDLLKFALSLCEVANVQFKSVGIADSAVGKFLRADAEASLLDDKMVAVFITPTATFYARRADTFASFMYRALAALAFYDRVILGCTESERASVKETLALLPSEAAEKLIALQNFR